MSMFGSLGNVGVLHGGKATFVYYLEHNASQVDIYISDDHGRIVYRESGMKIAGRNEMIWNGKNNIGQSMPEGVYRITVKATDAVGQVIDAKTYSAGKLTVDGKSSGLAFGDVTVPLYRVLNMREPSNV